MLFREEEWLLKIKIDYTKVIQMKETWEEASLDSPEGSSLVTSQSNVWFHHFHIFFSVH